MIRSLATGISGMRNHQVMLDVTSDNIANVSTTGFKSSTALFTDILTQTLRTAGLPTAAAGGTNPMQVGLGSRLEGIVRNLTQGSLQVTGRSTDVAISGDAYFVVNDEADQFFTRAGSFSLDSQGRMVTPSGALVQGWLADATGAINPAVATTNIVLDASGLIPPVQTSEINLGGNLSPTTAVGGTIDMSTFIYDETGNQVPLLLTFTKTAANTWTATAQYGSPATPVALTDSTVTFNGSGVLVTPADYTINIAGGAIPGFPDAIDLIVGGVGAPSQLTQYAGSSSPVVTDRNGAPTGSLVDFLIGADGTIAGVYSNGGTRRVAQLAVATFTNPGGLEKAGGLLRETVNSGAAQIRTAPATGANLNPGSLELSNVDLAQEFTALIIAQRGFQANTRVITTSDELLQEMINIRR